MVFLHVEPRHHGNHHWLVVPLSTHNQVGQTIMDSGNVAFPDAQAIEGKPSLRFADSDHSAPQARHQALYDEAKPYLLPVLPVYERQPVGSEKAGHPRQLSRDAPYRTCLGSLGCKDIRLQAWRG